MNNNNGLIPVQLSLIDHEIEGGHVHQDPADGYVNATDLCKAAGKMWGHYYENATTKDFLDELSSAIGIPITEQDQGVRGLIHTIQGGIPEKQGTWVHPQVAINLAQWLSPKFAVSVSSIIHDWMAGRVSGIMPPHVKRYIMNKSKIPPTHFSMLNEVYLELLAPIDDAGIKIPRGMTPDISTGKMFSGYLRDKGLNPDQMPYYEHEFMDNRPSVRARLYPIELLSDFKLWFHNVWMPTRAKSYFEERLPQAIPHIQHLFIGNNTKKQPPKRLS